MPYIDDIPQHSKLCMLQKNIRRVINTIALIFPPGLCFSKLTVRLSEYNIDINVCGQNPSILSRQMETNRGHYLHS